MTSYTWSQNDAQPCSLLASAGLLTARLVEAVVAFKLGPELHVQPLGLNVAPSGSCVLEARVYPGTRLYERLNEVTDCCAALTLDPQLFAEAVLGTLPPRLTPSEAVTAPCPQPALAHLEAVVVAREPGLPGAPAVLRLVPVAARVLGVGGYSRSLGCLVEILVAYTRAKAAFNEVRLAVERRAWWCGRLGNYLRALPHLVDCARRTGGDAVAGIAEAAARLTIGYAEAAGCELPEGLGGHPAQAIRPDLIYS